MYFCSMKKYALSILVFLVLIITLSACSDYKKLLKSDDIELKYTKAVEYYQNKDYFKSIQLFDELLTYFRGTEKAEEIYYYYAYSHYGKGDYVVASYYFNNFSVTFPRSKYAEETMFMAAYCQYLDSPKHSLDQESTVSALKGMQNFINSYPQSTRLAEANKVIDKLRLKLQKKSFEAAKLYFTIEEYNAAITALNAHLKDYPDSQFKEEAYFLILKSFYLYAINSIESKKKERFMATSESYETFAALYPESTFKREAENYYKIAQRELIKLKS